MNIRSGIAIVLWVWLQQSLYTVQATTISLWPATSGPSLVDSGPDNSVELGIKFQSDVAGTVTGVRFYKSTANGGTHVGNLWTANGTLMASGTFTGETGSGWQQVNFAQPISISASTQYIASYHAGAGHYSADLNYFTTTGVDNPPLHALTSQSSGGNGVFVYGSGSVFPNAVYKDMNYWVDLVFQTGTGLAITQSSPVMGTQSVLYSASLLATGGVTPYTWTISAGALPPGLVLNPGSGLISGTPGVTGTFSFTAQVTDSGTPVQIASAALTIVIGPVLAASDLWTSASVPTVADSGPDSAVELGVRFHSDIAGNINGIRFYKSPLNTGTHVGNLWSASGTLLSTAVFASESSSGWQQVSFSNPVAISASTDYVASYHALNGHYSADPNYFASKGADNPPLHAPANGSGGGNGLYAYGAASTFPSKTWSASNYWVDVVFQSGTQTTGSIPTVISVNPVPGATGVGVATTPSASFSEAMNSASINANTILLRDASGNAIPASIAYSSGGSMATLSPSVSLSPGNAYTAVVKGGPAGVADLSGNTMNGDFSWSFTTSASYGAKGGGPGGPILIISDPSNPFAEYLAEILLTEGLNEFDLKNISTVSPATLAAYDVVVLGQVSLSAAQVSMLTDWVNSGGNLIAMRPDKQLSGLLGLQDAGATIAEGYLLVNTGSGPGAGIVNQTIQFHGTADRYTLAGATSLADLYSSGSAAAGNPAITLRAVGTSGGQAAAFVYDLARSIVYTRQGNPAWAGEERDGLPPIRSNDLYYGNASFDPEPDWIDLNKVAIPQADEQQSFLVNLITLMNSSRRPLPRFWYFPHGNRAAVVMTGDDHANGGTTGRFEEYLSLSSSSGTVADWTAIRSSSYIYPNSPLSNAMAAAYNAQGFEIALHLNTGCSDYTRTSLDSMLVSQLSQFTGAYPSLPPMVTHRTHCIAWSDYTVMAEEELLHGIRMDCNYYYWPPAWVSDRPGLFTGSAMPMRFSMIDGNTIDIYQAVTEMTDESGQTYPKTIDALLDAATGPSGVWGAYVANMHTDYVNSPGSDWIIASAISHGVPVISARQLLTWCDARSSSAFQAVGFASNRLSFTVQAGSKAVGLEAMAPIPSGLKVTAVTLNGGSVAWTLRTVKGVQYAVLPAQNGSYQVSYAADTTPPSVVSLTPGNTQTGVYRDTPVVCIFSEALKASTVNANTITLYNSSNAIVPATVAYNEFNFTATLVPTSSLSASATYRAVIKGGAGGVSDIAGNSLASDFTSSFTTGTATKPYSLFGTTNTPTVAAASDTKAIEVGTQFSTATSGYITAVRFYKGAGNTGTHIGNVWTSGGTLLGSAHFTNETASGWQTQPLATPVAISANTIYVVSYHTTSGHYSADNGFFSIGWTNYPIRALGNGENGSNGVYTYNANSVFPSTASSSTNYWVDVDFVTKL